MNKLDVALASVPFDMACTLITYGADQAFIWTGAEPRDRADFFFNLGRATGRLQLNAFEKQWEEHDRRTLGG